jgi:hypothetical protein
MPEPLAMPVTVTGTPSIAMRRDAPFGTVSVVMMADTARNQCSGASPSKARGSAATIFSTGSGSMITPVENGSTSRGAQSSIEATAAHVLSAAAMPAAPVPALALPALTTSARSRPAPARCWRHTITGAAQKRFCVNTPAAVVPASNTARSTSSRSQRLIFAAAVPSLTPGTGNKSSARGGV